MKESSDWSAWFWLLVALLGITGIFGGAGYVIYKLWVAN